MTSNELKELVKAHFSLVEVNAETTEEVTESFTEETVEETFGTLKDVNGAFEIKFPGDSLQVGDKVTVVTSEGQEMDAPNGTHEMEDGTKIVTEDSVVKEIMGADGEKALSEEAMADVEDVVEDVVEKVVEEVVADEAMEEEAAVSTEEIVKEIVSAITEEMGYIKEKMEELVVRVDELENLPAAEPTMKAGPAKELETPPGS